MNQTDVYYRALYEYRKLTVANHECTSLRTSIANSNIEADRIEVKRAFCTIDEDWVNAIEAGLVHIEKAIKEDRQFIRSNGEIIPIEKVKHVSKESVEHLAKHSNLITRYHEGEDLIPDKLYTVERLNEYAVYENRFLYMLLCYLRDFVTIRYNEIIELTHKYEATINVNKHVSTGKRNLAYTITMSDVRKDDPYLKEHNPAKRIIDRIDLVLKAVLAFLATPLMEIVSKSPMLKPPITKTNVLKMDNNFKGAVALYDFIISYDKPGYTTEIEQTEINPFREDLADEMAEAGGLVSFLAYQYGLGMKQELKEAFALEEERRRAEQIRQRAERIESLKLRLQNGGVTLEEYVITIEKQLRALESEAGRAEALAEEVAALRVVEKQLNETVQNLTEDNARLKTELEEIEQRHFEEMETLKQAHEDELHDLILRHEAEVEQLNDEHREKIREMEADFREALHRLADEHRIEVDALVSSHEEEIGRITEAAALERERFETEVTEIRENAANEITAAKEASASAIAEADRVMSECRNELNTRNAEYEELLTVKRECEARVKALGGVDRDFTDRDSFNELEREYQAFTKLYKEQWNKTKKQIRKNHLNMKNLKGEAESSDSD